MASDTSSRAKDPEAHANVAAMATNAKARREKLCMATPLNGLPMTALRDMRKFIDLLLG